MDVGQSEVSAAPAVSQSFVIQPHQAQDCGMEIVDVHGLFLCAHSKLVTATIGEAAFHTTAGQ